MKLLTYDQLIWALKQINTPFDLIIDRPHFTGIGVKPQTREGGGMVYTIYIINNKLYFNNQLVQKHTINTVKTLFTTANDNDNEYSEFWYCKLVKYVLNNLSEIDRLYLFL